MEELILNDDDKFYGEHIGQRIKNRRVLSNLSQEELGNMLGMTKQAVFQYEKGIRVPNDDLLVRFANALKCSPFFLKFGLSKTYMDDNNNFLMIRTYDDLSKLLPGFSEDGYKEVLINNINKLANSKDGYSYINMLMHYSDDLVSIQKYIETKNTKK